MLTELKNALDKLSGDPQDVSANDLECVAIAVAMLTLVKIHPMALKGLEATIASKFSANDAKMITKAFRGRVLSNNRSAGDYSRVDYFESCRRRDEEARRKEVDALSKILNSVLEKVTDIESQLGTDGPLANQSHEMQVSRGNGRVTQPQYPK